MKAPQQNKSQQKRRVPHLSVRTLWIVGWLISAAALLVFFWPKQESILPDTVAKTQQGELSKPIEKAGQDRLLGRWVRSDGGYVIEIREAATDGKLDADYFNPNPIHVARGGWLMKQDKLMVEVELRDVNYPGSLYTLEFVADKDQLVGSYFQAVEGATFAVEFVREKTP